MKGIKFLLVLTITAILALALQQPTTAAPLAIAWEADYPSPSTIQVDIPQASRSSSKTITVFNTGNEIWYNNGSNAISINYRREPGDSGTDSGVDKNSKFYCNDWVNYHRISYMNESSVSPGNAATFTIWFCNPTNELPSVGYDWQEHFAIARGGEWIPTASTDAAKILARFKIPFEPTPPPSGGNYDLYVSSVEVRRNDTNQLLNVGDIVPSGTSINVKVYITNSGPDDLTEDTRVHYYDNNSYIDYDTRLSIDAGDTRSENESFIVNGVGTHILEVELDPYNTLSEGNEGNNRATFTLNVGDVPTPVITPPATGEPPTDVPTAIPTDTPIPTLTPIPTNTFTPIPTYTPTPSETPTPTVPPLTPFIPTDTPTPTYTPIPTNTPTPTHTPSPTSTLVPTPTNTPLPEWQAVNITGKPTFEVTIYNSGRSQSITVDYRNIGWRTWFDYGSERVVLAAINGQSAFRCNDWPTQNLAWAGYIVPVKVSTGSGGYFNVQFCNTSNKPAGDYTESFDIAHANTLFYPNGGATQIAVTIHVRAATPTATFTPRPSPTPVLPTSTPRPTSAALYEAQAISNPSIFEVYITGNGGVSAPISVNYRNIGSATWLRSDNIVLSYRHEDGDSGGYESNGLWESAFRCANWPSTSTSTSTYWTARVSPSTVSPNNTATFAPTFCNNHNYKPGIYVEHFDLAHGINWFYPTGWSGKVTVQVHVVAANVTPVPTITPIPGGSWQAEAVTNMTFDVYLTGQGQSEVIQPEYRNTGSQTWLTNQVYLSYRYENKDSGTEFLASCNNGQGCYKASAFSCADWVSAYQPRYIATNTAANQSGKFSFKFCNRNNMAASATPYIEHYDIAHGDWFYANGWSGKVTVRVHVGGTVIPTPVTPTPIPSGGSCSAESIDALLAKNNSPLKGYGNVFMAKGQKYNVDPRLVVAIAGAESTFGKNLCATYNAWGWMWPQGTCYNFPSWDGDQGSIDKVSWQLGQRYIHDWKLTNISSIGSTWCATGCQNWKPNVRQFYLEQGGDSNTGDLTFATNCNASPPPSNPVWRGRYLHQTQSPMADQGVLPGEKITAQVTVLNESNVTWSNNPADSNAIGFYVRKQCASTVGPSGDEEGGSQFYCPSWKTQHRVTWMKENQVKPGDTATFEFEVCVPNRTVVGNYREDFGVAYGSEWLDNPYNGDPDKKLAAWIPINVKGNFAGSVLPTLCQAVIVQGRITSQKDGSGIEGARVSIGGQAKETNANGNYSLNDILPNRYTVRIEADGYETHQGQVTVSASGSTTYNAALKARPVSDGFYLPYPGGVSYSVTQAPGNPAYSHGSLPWAYDFTIPTDSAIVASNDGKVNSITPGYNNGLGQNIVLKHRDGSYTIYGHILNAVVSKGQEVSRGTVIAKSGGEQEGANRGYSSGAHLHFHRGTVLNSAGRPLSVRTTFRDVAGDGLPKAHQSYKSGNYPPARGQLMTAAVDTEPPTGSVQFLLTGQMEHNLWFYAFDYDSDNLEMRLASNQSDLLTAKWQSYSSEAQWPLSEVWIQYRDESQNVSEVYSNTIDSIAYGPIQASVAINPTVCTNSVLQVNNQTTPICEQCSWSWDFGNGIQSTNPNPEFAETTYADPGIYTISLTVDGLMNTSSVATQVTVLPSPSSNFTISKKGNVVAVEATETNATGWLWDFGDGTIATGRTTTHTYSDTPLAQNYPIALIVTGTNECVVERYQYVSDLTTEIYLPIILK